MALHADDSSSWNILAIGALVASIVVPPLGLALGIVALANARRRHLEGGRLAVAAIVVAGVMCVATVLSVLVWVSFDVEYTATTQTVDMLYPFG